MAVDSKQLQGIQRGAGVKLATTPIEIQTAHYKKLKVRKYRFASWKIGGEEWQKPDIILNNGQIERRCTSALVVLHGSGESVGDS